MQNPRSEIQGSILHEILKLLLACLPSQLGFSSSRLKFLVSWLIFIGVDSRPWWVSSFVYESTQSCRHRFIVSNESTRVLRWVYSSLLIANLHVMQSKLVRLEIDLTSKINPCHNALNSKLRFEIKRSKIMKLSSKFQLHKTWG